MRAIELTTVEYHSAQWMILVSVGWVTMFVDDGIAHMIR